MMGPSDDLPGPDGGSGCAPVLLVLVVALAIWYLFDWRGIDLLLENTHHERTTP